MNQNTTEYKLRKILEKCMDDETRMSRCLSESRISHLIVEVIDEADIKVVKDEIEKSRGGVSTLRKYIKDLNLSSDVTSVVEYIDLLDSTLNDAQGTLATASLDSGWVGNLQGEKLTLPNLTKAAIAISTKSTEFLSGLTTAITNIRNNLLPLVKAADTGDSLESAAGKNGIPDTKTLKAGILKAFTQSLGGAKKGFFANMMTRLTTGGAGAGVDLIQKMTDAAPSPENMANSLAIALMSTPIGILKGIPEPPNNNVVPEEGVEPELTDVLDDVAPKSDEEPTAGGKTADKNVPTGEDESLSPAVVAKVDAAADELVAKLGKIPIAKKKLTALLKKQADLGEDGITGKGRKATAQRRKFRLAINDIAGKTIFEEGLLTGSRRAKPKKDSSEDTETFDRWKELAGIKS